ncbi:hypothetical protein [Brevundimonas diminuta]|uniref:hypothetical protein n=1 Tax=Brevundimonas diminuta TaxID=293 RepID=UPI003D9A3E9C
MGIAFTTDELLSWARSRWASVDAMCAEIGCTTYRYYKIKADGHWLSKAILLEAATRCLRKRGHVGLQTTLLHFTGEPA